jgi:hypothetical protein
VKIKGPQPSAQAQERPGQSATQLVSREIPVQFVVKKRAITSCDSQFFQPREHADFIRQRARERDTGESIQVAVRCVSSCLKGTH